MYVTTIDKRYWQTDGRTNDILIAMPCCTHTCFVSPRGKRYVSCLLLSGISQF